MGTFPRFDKEGFLDFILGARNFQVCRRKLFLKVKEKGLAENKKIAISDDNPKVNRNYSRTYSPEIPIQSRTIEDKEYCQSLPRGYPAKPSSRCQKNNLFCQSKIDCPGENVASLGFLQVYFEKE